MNNSNRIIFQEVPLRIENQKFTGEVSIKPYFDKNEKITTVVIKVNIPLNASHQNIEISDDVITTEMTLDSTRTSIEAMIATERIDQRKKSLKIERNYGEDNLPVGIKKIIESSIE